MRVVADTNVLVSVIRSPQGASGFVLRESLAGRLSFGLSPALLLEYEDVLKRPGILGEPPKISLEQVDVILDALCAKARHGRSYFRFRPVLRDPKDDLLVECALATNASIILTRDNHFVADVLRPYRLSAMTPKEFLQTIYQKEA
jgi:putative PIN family toxin of toxin-antitoxin system